MPRELQERIRRYAERHQRSLDGEVMRVLEREFPAPLSLERRVEDLIGLIEVMRGQGSPEAVIDRLNDELYELVKGIAVGQVKGLADDYRGHVRDKLQGWEREQMGNQQDRYMEEMDQEELDSMWLRGDPFKNDV
jgi:hypothetical protein